MGVFFLQIDSAEWDVFLAPTSLAGSTTSNLRTRHPPTIFIAQMLFKLDVSFLLDKHLSSLWFFDLFIKRLECLVFFLYVH